MLHISHNSCNQPRRTSPLTFPFSFRNHSHSELGGKKPTANGAKTCAPPPRGEKRFDRPRSRRGGWGNAPKGAKDGWEVEAGKEKRAPPTTEMGNVSFRFVSLLYCKRSLKKGKRDTRKDPGGWVGSGVSVRAPWFVCFFLFFFTKRAKGVCLGKSPCIYALHAFAGGPVSIQARWRFPLSPFLCLCLSVSLRREDRSIEEGKN